MTGYLSLPVMMLAVGRQALAPSGVLIPMILDLWFTEFPSQCENISIENPLPLLKKEI